MSYSLKNRAVYVGTVHIQYLHLIILQDSMTLNAKLWKSWTDFQNTSLNKRTF